MKEFFEIFTVLFQDTFNNFARTVSAFMPSLLKAAVLLIAGLVLAWVTKWAIVRLGKGIDRLANAAGLSSFNTGIKWPMATILGWIAYWVIILFFVTAAVKILKLPALAEVLGKFIHILPSLLVAGVIIVGGVLLGTNLRDRITSGVRATGLRQAEILGKWVRMIVIILATIVGLAQVGIDVRLFEQILIISIAAIAGSIALSFGIGAGTTVSNIISARYIRSNYRVGQKIQIKDTQGRILELLPTGVVLDTDQGRTFIPARIFDQEASILLDNK